MTPLVLNLDLLAKFNAGVRAAVAANRDECPVTTYARHWSRPCRQSLADGARFCPKHEADRIRLGGVA